jgi:hypothetical protein
MACFSAGENTVRLALIWVKAFIAGKKSMVLLLLLVESKVFLLFDGLK